MPLAHRLPPLPALLPSWQVALGMTVIVALAALTRLPLIGDPTYHVDEQFYHLVAARLADGALPYVDIWDRKPVGLFLVYLAGGALSGGSIAGSQWLAAAAAIATAIVIAATARRCANGLAGFAAGALYILWLPVYAGAAGQSPVFYNLLVAGAAYLIIRSNADSPDRRRAAELFAMLLCGLAIQIKYTAAIEAIAFGLYVAILHLRETRPLWRGVRHVLLLAMTGLIPTAAVVAYYWNIDAFQAFFYANFSSIFARASMGSYNVTQLFAYITITLAPLALAAGWGAAMLVRDGRHPLGPFILTWLASAIAAFAVIGNFYDHYALPLLPPLLIAASILFQKRRVGPILVGVLAMVALVWAPLPSISDARARRADMDNAAQIIGANLNGGCAYIYDGPSWLYLASGSCLPTSLAYPDHLSNAAETRAVGLDTRAELRRILALSPPVIVTASRPIVPQLDPVNRESLATVLHRDYLPAARIQDSRWSRTLVIHVLRDDRVPCGSAACSFENRSSQIALKSEPQLGNDEATSRPSSPVGVNYRRLR